MDLNQRIDALTPEQRALFELLAAKEREKKRRERPPEPPPVERAEPAEHYPLSLDQERLWFIHALEPDSTSYNVDAAMRLAGELDVAAFDRAASEIIARHEIWRTSFPVVDGRPMQKVHPARPVSIPVVDLSGLGWELTDDDLRTFALAEMRHLFDFENGPLVRMRLLRLGPRDHLFLLAVHHIVNDWFAFHNFWQELAALYQAFRAGEPSPLPELPVQYKDYTAWQRRWMSGEAEERYLEFWLAELEDMPRVLTVPTDYPRPSRYTSRGRKVAIQVDRRRSDALKRLGGKEGASLFMTLAALYTALLVRWTGQEKMLLASPGNARPRRELEPLLGFFLTQLVYPCDAGGDPSFRDYLGRIRSRSLRCLPYGDMPFSKLVEALQPERDASRPPLVQTNLLLLDAEYSQLALPGLGISPLLIDDQAARYDLSMAIWDTGEGIFKGNLEYNVTLFDHTTVQRLVAGFHALIDSVLEDPDRPLSRLGWLAPAVRQQVLREWNDTASALGREPWIPARFAAQVARAPDAAALAAGGEVVTYGELARRASALARRLRRLGVGPEEVVALVAGRSPELVVAILGVLAAGGAYLPVDPDYPAERIELLLTDAGARWVLAGAEAPQLPLGEGVTLLDLEGEVAAARGGAGTGGEADHAPGTALPGEPLSPQSLAYIIYTSGSTGTPKGVAVSHGALAHHQHWAARALPFSAGSRVLQQASPSFDASVWEIFSPLLAGGTLVLAPGRLRDPQSTVRVLQEHAVTSIMVVPSLYRLLVAEEGFAACASLAQMVSGGEALSRQLAVSIQAASRGRLYNIYGPTETTINVTFIPVEGDGEAAPPLGRPIANARVTVVDGRFEPLPPGAPGEVVLGGATLARGYLRRPALTAERFVPDLFASQPGARLYRTGDLGRLDAAGRLHYLGRMDHQVKVRGFRIEPGEIEAALRRHPAVEEAVVVAQEDAPEHQRLVAYAAVGEGPRPGAEELRSFLAPHLPDYMLPGAFVVLGRLPLTPTGKVDRRALPAPEISGTAGAEAPASWAEAQLAAIWGRVLGAHAVGPQDSFFSLGGDSILSIQVVSQARQQGIHLEPGHLFQHQTLRQLASVATVTAAPRAEQGPVTGPAPLTPIQHAFFQLAPPRPDHFNLSVMLEVPSGLDPRLLSAALAELARHHDALRLRFTRGEEGWRQENLGLEVVAASAPEVAVCALEGLPEPDRPEVLATTAAALQASLDVGRGPLLRAALFRWGGEEPARLLLVAHHLVMDGVSWRLLLQDLQTAYDQLAAGGEVSLPAKTTAFAEWARRLEEHAASPELAAELDLWTALGEEGPEPAPLPLDSPGGSNLCGDEATVHLALEPGESREVLTWAGGGAAVEEVLLAALGRALGRWSGGDATLVEVEGHGREALFADVDLSRTVGWFTCSFPLALPGAAAEPASALAAVRQRLGRLPHGGIGHGLLHHLAGGDVARRLAALPRPQVSFNYLGQVAQAAESAFRLAEEPTGPSSAAENPRFHPLGVQALFTGGRLHLTLAYSRGLHRRETVEELAGWLRQEVAAVAAAASEAAAGDFEDFGWDSDDVDALRDAIGDALGEE